MNPKTGRRAPAAVAGPDDLDPGLAGDTPQSGEVRRHRTLLKEGVLSFLDTGGTGRVAVFIHGLGTSALLWRRVLTGVEDLRRCVALDLPLHGDSPLVPGKEFSLPVLAELVIALCDDLGLAEFDLVGNDTGGAVAQVVAARHQDRVATLTLTNCDVYDNIPTRAFLPTYLLARIGLLAPLSALMMRNLPQARRRGYGAGYEDVETALPLSVAQAWLTPLMGTPQRAQAFQRVILSIKAKDLVAIEPQLTRLETPTNLIWGTGDTFFPLRWAHKLQATIPGVRSLDLVPGGRLFFPDERGPELVAILRRNWTS